jgi:serine/threonine protein kinase
MRTRTTTSPFLFYNLLLSKLFWVVVLLLGNNNTDSFLFNFLDFPTSSLSSSSSVVTTAIVVVYHRQQQHIQCKQHNRRRRTSTNTSIRNRNRFYHDRTTICYSHINMNKDILAEKTENTLLVVPNNISTDDDEENENDNDNVNVNVNANVNVNGNGNGNVNVNVNVNERHHHRNIKSLLDRRFFVSLSSLFWGSVLPAEAEAEAATFEEKKVVKNNIQIQQSHHHHQLMEFGISDRVVESLVYERVLGSGSYKKVYLVSGIIMTTDDHHDYDDVAVVDDDDNDDDELIVNTNNRRVVRYAMAVERLRYRRDVKNAFRGVRIPKLIQHQGKLVDNNNNDDVTNKYDYNNDDEGDLFESILGWWIQSSNVPEYVKGRNVFIPAGDDHRQFDISSLKRTQNEPKKNFIGSRWMISFKPVYETDLKRFIHNSPVLYPIMETKNSTTSSGLLPSSSSSSSLSSTWTEPNLMKFVREIIHAGKLMHESGIVHRDIKQKNIMMMLTLSSTTGETKRMRPVIIDFGFSEFGRPVSVEGQQGEKEICAVQPGQLKGEVEYVLAEDLANYRGCQRGDTYAMGKTLYEFIFGSSTTSFLLSATDKQDQQQQQDGTSGKPSMTLSFDEAKLQNEKFRNHIFGDTAGKESRFYLSQDVADCILSIIRGLCRQNDPLSFADAERILSFYISSLLIY